MKKLIVLTVLILITSLLISCNQQLNEKLVSEITSNKNDPITESVVIDYELSDTEDHDTGGSHIYTDFNESFILLSNGLSHIIDMDKLSTWDEKVMEAHKQEKGDPYLVENIYEFIKFFKIPREKFEDLYYSTNLYYMYDYNFDLLYSDDNNKVYEYYSNNSDDFIKKNYELSIKQDIKEYIGLEIFSQWLSDNKIMKYNDYSDVSWSIPEVIYYFNIPREVIDNIINHYLTYEDDAKIYEVQENGTEVLVSGTNVFDYDIDKIYNNKDDLTKLINSGMSGYLIDETVRKN